MKPPCIDIGRGDLERFGSSAGREWLVTNGLGGFAAGTVAGACTRRYHGLLVAALRPPVERTVMVAKLEIFAEHDGGRYALTSNEYVDGTIDPSGYRHLDRFRLDGGTPVWTFVLGDAVLEQRIVMPEGRNTTWVTLTLQRGSGPMKLSLRPLCTYRDYHSHARGDGWQPALECGPDFCEVRAFQGARPYRLTLGGGRFVPGGEWYWGFRHRAETARGLDDREDLFNPGRFEIELAPGASVTLAISAEDGEPVESLAQERESRRRERLLQAVDDREPEWVRQLVIAADQFIVGRAGAGGGGRTVIAGYPWFSDWGRDTMIALPGLTLATRRFDVAADILRTFGRFVSEGMLPNRFPDSGEMPEYNTVDATLWYFHAVHETWTATADRTLVAELYPILVDIVEWHLKGTRYGIRVDSDGLLAAGEAGVQLTWMDAKVGDWVVTPRSGKAVEINALWYRALRVMQALSQALGDTTAERRFATLARKTRQAFRERFWLADGRYLADVVDGPDGIVDVRGRRFDPSLRPNQIFAVSLEPDLLPPEQQAAVVEICQRQLWTPLGLRSLAADEPGYRPHYGGGPVERDGAYHEGTVWSWLLGPFASAHYRVHGDARAARGWLAGIAEHLRHGCIGSVSEIFDGEPPHRPEGCFAQAWSVSEVLRAWLEIGRLESLAQQAGEERVS